MRLHAVFLSAIMTVLTLLSAVICNGCSRSGSSGDNSSEKSADTLRVATLYGPTTYFDYRGQKMGYEYENVKRFASDEGMVLDLTIANSVPEMLSALQKGDVDLVVYPVARIDEYGDKIRHCGQRELPIRFWSSPRGRSLCLTSPSLLGKMYMSRKTPNIITVS